MFIYYDVLMLDKQSLLSVRHSERFKILTSLVECQSGWAELVPRRTIDFGSRMAASDLRNVFAKTITAKQEGLVLKPDEPYFDFSRGDRPIGARCIKLKKEYIGNFGDIGDLAAVGAGYDPDKVKSLGIPHLRWTHFYVGTLNNKEKVQRWRAKPEFTVTNVVELNETLLKSVMQNANPRPVPRMENTVTELHLPVGVEKNPPMTVAFENPLVFDLRCFSFDKEGNTGFWTPRFPGVTKVHFDRDFMDCLSFDQLQELALESTTVPDLPDSQENLEWIARLEGADPRRIAVDAESEGSLSTMPTPSPGRHSTQSSEPHSQQSALSLPASTSQVSISQSNRFKPTAAFAVSTSHLATPPTSSAPEEVAEEQTRTSGNLQTFKSPQSAILDPATSNKRRRASHAPTTAPTSHIKRRRSSPIRKPLSEIDGNNSQTSPSSVKMGKVREPEIIDLTSSPEPSFKEPVITASDSPIGDSALTQDSQPISVFPPDDENDDSGAVATTEQDQEPECTFAGTKCGFFNTCIILSPCLADPPREVRTVIDTHGLNNATMSVDEWLGSYGKLGGSLQHDGVPGKTIVLVDSLEHISETEKVLKTLDDHRSRESRKRQEWITAYDWRVLRYVSIMEDESVTRKYYDGFTDPWLRWFCGLV
jgi:DNA ligase 4